MKRADSKGRRAVPFPEPRRTRAHGRPALVRGCSGQRAQPAGSERDGGLPCSEASAEKGVGMVGLDSRALGTEQHRLLV